MSSGEFEESRSVEFPFAEKGVDPGDDLVPDLPYPFHDLLLAPGQSPGVRKVPVNGLVGKGVERAEPAGIAAA